MHYITLLPNRSVEIQYQNNIFALICNNLNPHKNMDDFQMDDTYFIEMNEQLIEICDPFSIMGDVGC